MRKKKIKSLIFGISGQDGSYLSRFLLNKKMKSMVSLEMLAKEISKILLGWKF